jgi:hypothetical protein
VLGRTDEAIRLSPVLIAVELAAVSLWLVRLSPIGRMLARALETNLEYLVACVVLLAVVAVLAAAHSRGGRRDLARLARWTLCLVGTAMIGVPLVVYVASLFGLVGA